MSEDHLTRLFPAPQETVPLPRCYLDAEVRPRDHEGLFVYTNYVVSLDGRISIVPPETGTETVPPTTANGRDWRLFQELAGHADVLITSGRYMRELEAGTAQDALPVGTGDAYADVREWRLAQGLREQPDVAILSGSLDFRLPEQFEGQRRRVFVFTSEDAPADRRAALERAGARVMPVVPAGMVRGRPVIDTLSTEGYQAAYCVTGPYVLHTVVADGLLDSLFLTTVHRLLSGERFATFLNGPLLDPAEDYRLRWLYYDASAPDGVGQTLARYDRRPRTGA